MKTTACCLLLSLVTLLPACKTTGSDLEPLEVLDLATQTVASDGTVSDAEWIGKKRVRIAIDPGDHALQPAGAGVQVSFWKPGGFEDTEAAQLVPGSSTEFRFDLPTSEELGICQYLLYRWTVVYDHAGTGTPGTFIGQTRFVMPTKQMVNGQLVQALCSGPEL